MKNKNVFGIFAWLLLLSGFAGCVQTVDLGGLPYEEKLVIQAVLRAGEPAQFYFTRTFGFDEVYTVQKAAIRDVSGALIYNGVSFPLGYSQQLIRNNIRTGFAIYEAGGLIMSAGQTYSITANWNGHRLEAQTSIPDAAIVDTAFLSQTSGQFLSGLEIVTRINSRGNTVYTANYELRGFTTSSSDRSGDIVQLGKDGETIVLKLPLNSIDTSGSANSLFVNVFTFDEAFYNYYRTRNNDRVQGEFSLIFSGAPGPVHWNVEGEALGMFIGMNKTRKKVTVQ